MGLMFIMPLSPQVIGGLPEQSCSSSATQLFFPSLLGLTVHQCRSQKLFKNDKTLVTSLEDTYLRVNQILGRRNKEARIYLTSEI